MVNGYCLILYKNKYILISVARSFSENQVHVPEIYVRAYSAHIRLGEEQVFHVDREPEQASARIVQGREYTDAISQRD